MDPLGNRSDLSLQGVRVIQWAIAVEAQSGHDRAIRSPADLGSKVDHYIGSRTWGVVRKSSRS